MLRIALAFSAGTAAVLGLPALGPAVIAAAPALAAGLCARRRPVLAAALAGFAWTYLLAAGWVGTGWPCARDREEMPVVGRVASPPLEREGRTDFDLEVTGQPPPAPGPRRIRVAWYRPDGLPQPGECWRFELRLRCRHGLANPGAPDRDLALLRERIDATAYVAGKSDPERLTRPAGHAVERLRARIAGAIAGALPPGPSAAVLQGLSVGVRGAIPDRLWEAFSVTGIAHLVAISGLHVTGCAIAVLALLRLAWRVPLVASLPSRLPIEGAVVTGATAAYAVLSGGSLPALRTLAMVAVFAALRALRRTWPLHGSLALAGLLLVAADPLALTSAGFWLSFVATATLLAAASGGAGWRQRILDFAKAQLAVTTLLTPVLAATFGRISLVAPFVNAAAIPFFSVVLLPAVLAGTVLAAIEPTAAGMIWRALGHILDPAWPALESIAQWDGASWSPAAQPPALVAAAGLAAFAALLLPVTGLRCAAASLFAALLLGRAEPPAVHGYTLTVVDVGQGLAAVVETSRHVLIFDTGARWQGGGAAARVSLLPYLRARGIRTVDRLVVSHDDQDHAGGLEELRRALRVLHKMAAPGSRLRADETCRRGDEWRWDGVSFRVLHPPARFDGGDNDRSCALAVAGPGGTALLLADPEAAAEAELGAQPIAADLILVPHHGSRSSSSPGLVAAASPRYAIASAGFGNRWGMPDAGVVARWRAAGASVLVTAEEGAIRARFPPRPGPIRITTERRDNPRWWRPGARD
jgi:competence protein ComEC